MKIHVRFMTFILLAFSIFLLSGCGEELETVPIEDREIEEKLIDLVEEYQPELVRVVNDGSFSELERFLIPNHTYRNIRAYVKDMQSKKIRLNLVEQSIVGVYVAYENDVEIYCVDVTEIVEEIQSEDSVNLIERNLRYEIISHHDDYRIESIVGR